MNIQQFSPALYRLNKKMADADSYEDWGKMAIEYDRISGADAWRRRADNELFDAHQIITRHERLKAQVSKGDVDEILFTLNEGIHGNMGGMGSAKLYEQAKFGTKLIIEDYVSLITEALGIIADAPESELSKEAKITFFRRASHCYGRSALSLSGGAGLVYFHHGVIDAMWREGVLPTVFSGSSAGAWVCAQLAGLTDSELDGYFRNKRYDNGKFSLKRSFRQSKEKNAEELLELVDSFVGDMTFQEAFEHTGRNINITVAPLVRHQKSRLLNAMTSPNVTVRSAVMASCAMKGFMPPAELEAKDFKGKLKPYLQGRFWVDGSLAEDLPFKRLSRLYGVNHYIVSMINPAGAFSLHDIGGQDDSIYRSAKRVVGSITRESLHIYRKLVGYTPITKPIGVVIDAVFGVTNQSYIGDINMRPDLGHMNTRNLFFGYESEEEVEKIVKAGMVSAWQKIERIRTATRISREIDRCLEKLEIESFCHNEGGVVSVHPLV